MTTCLLAVLRLGLALLLLALAALLLPLAVPLLPLAAEATRNTSLAVEVCGGEVPEEYRTWLENPFCDRASVPQ